MSFCYLLNTMLLFTGVVAFIIAGFAGTFSRRLHNFRYRLMLGPLGFVILGSLAHSIATRLVNWFAHAAHAASPGSAAGIFESAALLLAGIAGVLVGIALGATLDRTAPTEQTYTIANYWTRRRPQPSNGSQAANPHRANVIAISERRKQPDAVRRVNAISENE